MTDIKGGKIEFRVDKHANLHFIIGKASFDEKALVENYAAALEEILRLKPSASKGRYIEKATMTTTMGPGIPLDYTQPATCWSRTRPPPDLAPRRRSPPPLRGGGLPRFPGRFGPARPGPYLVHDQRPLVVACPPGRTTEGPARSGQPAQATFQRTPRHQPRRARCPVPCAGAFFMQGLRRVVAHHGREAHMAKADKAAAIALF